VILLNTGTFSSGCGTNRDWFGLQQWLTSPLCSANLNRQGLILDGNEVGYALDQTLPQFLSQELGADYLCTPYWNPGCPSGEPENDQQYCVRVEPASGAVYGDSIPVDLFGNWCPAKLQFNVLGPAGTGVGNRVFEKVGSGAQTQYAQIVNDGSGSTGNYRTVLNAYSSHFLAARDLDAAPDPQLECPIDDGSRLAATAQSIQGALRWVLSPQDPRTLGLCQASCNAAETPEAGATAALVNYLYPGFPNPFNPRTTIRFSLAADGKATLVIYDVAGRTVRTLVDGAQNAGPHAVVWDGTNDAGRVLPSGVYWCRLSAAGFTSNRRMVVLK
jgi:hypothetical protein